MRDFDKRRDGLFALGGQSGDMGLPPRIALPIMVVIGVLFLGAMGYLLHAGLGTTGSAFGPGVHNGGDTNLQATAAPVTAR